MKKLVVLSGAGISAESGIATFRDSNGLWENYSIEEVATPQAWKRDPDLVTRFYNERRKTVAAAMPNAAHRYFAGLEKEFDVAVVTQNIDDLHERAGSTNVLHLHGNIMQCKSSGPNQEKEYFPVPRQEITQSDLCPEGYRLRPHVVWFGEEVPNLGRAAHLVSQADILIIIGTSLNVYPAAGLMEYAGRNVRKFIIDPKVDALSTPSDFVKIAETATAGVKELDKYLR